MSVAAARDVSRLARPAGLLLLAGLAVLFALRLRWVSLHLAELSPVGGGDAAPAFTLPLLTGGELRYPDGAAVTVIDFFATWCGPCREELPRVDALARRVRDRGVKVYAVDAEPPEAREFVEKLVADEKLSLPIGLDGSGVAERYRVSNLPHIVVIDRGGRIARVMLGERTDEELDEAVKSALER